jgi:hypothetical protein
MLRKTEEMSSNVNDVEFNSLGRKVKKLLADYEGKELPKEEFDKLVKLLTNQVDDNLASGIKEDLENILK